MLLGPYYGLYRVGKGSTGYSFQREIHFWGQKWSFQIFRSLKGTLKGQLRLILTVFSPTLHTLACDTSFDRIFHVHYGTNTFCPEKHYFGCLKGQCSSLWKPFPLTRLLLNLLNSNIWQILQLGFIKSDSFHITLSIYFLNKLFLWPELVFGWLFVTGVYVRYLF